ncbi:MAG: hybrid sensor histidine kinase/response regulator, partial [Firmicutes bacterium]|nr:hybrid sensor histidine kinase/response regulator [Bacillota bacterium]
MKAKSKRKNLAFVLTACLLAFLLLGGAFFAQYLNTQIFAERTTQLLEITTQVRVNLNNALNSYWNYNTTAVNILEKRDIESADQAIQYLGELENTMNTKEIGSYLMLLDSSGNCYNSEGKHGVWSDIDVISDGNSKYTFITESELYG